MELCSCNFAYLILRCGEWSWPSGMGVALRMNLPTIPTDIVSQTVSSTNGLSLVFCWRGW